MKKIFTLMMIVLLLAVGSFAAEVTISPEEPTTTDDLYCLVNGQAYEEYNYLWLNNGQEIAQGNPLSAGLTSLGETYTCEASYPGPWGPSFVGDAHVDVLIEGQGSNAAPIVDLPEPIVINGPTDEQCVNLDDSVVDDSTADEDILWSYDGQNNINVELKTLIDGRFACFTASGNSDLSEDITFFASDGELSGSDTIEVIYDASEGQDENNAPFLEFTYPTNGKEFFVGQEILFALVGGDVDGDTVSVEIAFGDSNLENLGDFEGSIITTVAHTYNVPGTYNVKAIANDGDLTYEANVDVVIKVDGINYNNVEVSNLETFSDAQFTDAETVFYRGESMYVKFNLIDQTTGEQVNPEGEEIIVPYAFGDGVQYSLDHFSGFVDGHVVVAGKDSEGTFYYQWTPIPLSDDALIVDEVGILFGAEGYGAINEIYTDIEVRNNLPTMSIPLTVNVPVNGVREIYLFENAEDVEDFFPEGLDFEMSLLNTDTYVANADLGGGVLNVYGKNLGSTSLTVSVVDSEGAKTTRNLNIQVGGILEAPVADAGSWKEIKPGTTISLDGSGSYDPDGEIVAWRWSIEGVTIGLGEIIDHTFETLGEYDVTLTVVDNDGLTNSDTVLIRVVTNPKDMDYDKLSPHSNAWPKVNNVLLANFAPLQYKPVYSAGESIPMYVKFRNNSPENGQVQVKFILTDTNGVLKNMHNLKVWTGDVKIFTTEMPLPENLGAGTYVIKAIVTDNSGIGQLSDNWVVNIA